MDHADPFNDEEKGPDDDAVDLHAIVERTEDPGIDALRGTFGALGTIVRVRRRRDAVRSATRPTMSRNDDRWQA